MTRLVAGRWTARAGFLNLGLIASASELRSPVFLHLEEPARGGLAVGLQRGPSPCWMCPAPRSAGGRPSVPWVSSASGGAGCMGGAVLAGPTNPGAPGSPSGLSEQASCAGLSRGRGRRSTEPGCWRGGVGALASDPVRATCPGLSPHPGRSMLSSALRPGPRAWLHRVHVGGADRVGEQVPAFSTHVARWPADQHKGRPSPAGRSRSHDEGPGGAVQPGGWEQPADGTVPQPLASAAFLSDGSEDAAGLAPGPPAAPRPVRAVGPPSASLSALSSGRRPPAPIASEPGGPVSGRGRGSGERRSGWHQVLSELRVLFADWRDPEFLRDVEAATGVDLGSARAGRRGKGKRRRHPGLTDLRQQTNTARTRIAKKIFAK